MVLPGSGFFGNPYLAFNGMHYAYNLDLRTEPYANLYQKPSSIMNMTVLTDDRVHGETIGPRKRIAMAVSYFSMHLTSTKQLTYVSAVVAVRGRFVAVAIGAMASHAPTAPTRTIRLVNSFA